MQDNTAVYDIQKIQKVNVSQATFDIILGKIMDGTWKQGEKIPSENELRLMLGVSRHTIRSAITNLNMLGILQTRRGDGNYVKGTGVALYIDFLLPYLFASKMDVCKILEFRESVESTATRYTALRMTNEDLKNIEAKMHLCEQHTESAEYPEYDFDFHLAIAEASKSDLLIQSMYIVKKYCFAAIREYFNDTLVNEGAHLHHLRIFEALSNRDADSASEAMGNHIRSIIRFINNART